jgi:hypothetical protein
MSVAPERGAGGSLVERLQRIEQALDDGSYRPGPWAAFVRAAARRSAEERRALESAVSRVSDKLHRRRARRTMPASVALGLEVAATAAGVALLSRGLAGSSTALGLAAAAILTTTAQPLIKVLVGRALGIRYSYAYLAGVEPRFKMRYGTYLAASRWRRVLLHLSGTVGSPLALWTVGSLATPTLPTAAFVCVAGFWLLVAMQVVPFLLGIAGRERAGPMRLGETSGGAAGLELHAALAGRGE